MQLLKKISMPVIARILMDKFDIELEVNKTFEEMGLDELDEVELMMYIEKELDISISDEDWLEFSSKPMSNWLSNFREQRIDEIINR